MAQTIKSAQYTTLQKMFNKCYLLLLLFMNLSSFMSKALSIYILIIWDLFTTFKHNVTTSVFMSYVVN